MPRAVAAIRDRGNTEPYSDTNSPGSLEMTTGVTPATPPANEVVLSVPAAGTSLNMTNSSGVTTTIGPSTPSYLGTVFSNRQYSVGASTSAAFGAANASFFVPVPIDGPCTLTGIRFRKGTSTTTANIIVALYNTSGTRIAVSNSVATGTTANIAMSLGFTATLNVTAGLYWAFIIGSSTSASYYGAASNEYYGPAQPVTQSSFAAPASFSPPPASSNYTLAVPYLFTY